MTHNKPRFINLCIALVLLIQSVSPVLAAPPSRIAISDGIALSPHGTPLLNNALESHQLPKRDSWLERVENNDQLHNIVRDSHLLAPARPKSMAAGSAVMPRRINSSLYSTLLIQQPTVPGKPAWTKQFLFPNVVAGWQSNQGLVKKSAIENAMAGANYRLDQSLLEEPIRNISDLPTTPALASIDTTERATIPQMPALTVASYQAQTTDSWAVGNLIGLNCGTEIRTGPGLEVHTIVPEDNWTVMIIGGPRLEGGQTWWDTSRAAAGDPSGGTGWVAQEQSEAATCDGGGDPPAPVWAVGVVLGVCAGTEIRHGPELAIHTVVPENNWNVFIVDGPRIVDGQTWWDTSRELAGDPSGGTGWISQEQAEQSCIDGGSGLSYVGPLPLSPELRALLRQMGYRHFQVAGGDPVNMANGNFIQQITDLSIPGVAGFALTIERTYNSADPRQGHFGTGWTSWLDTNLRIANDGTVDLRYPDGHSTYFVLNGDHYEPGQPGVFDKLTYVAPGFELRLANQMVYLFDQQGYLTESRDRHGNAIQFTRNGDHQITEIIDSARRQYTITNSGRFITAITDPAGRTIHYTYANDDLVTVTDGKGGVQRYEYENHRLTKLTDPESILFLQNLYDSNGRVIEQIDAGGSHSYFTYGEDGVTTFTDPLNRQTRYVHDALNRIVQIQDALSNIESFAYDDDYNRIGYTDKRNNSWQYTYDNRGNMLSETDPFGTVITYAYSDQNDLLSMTDAGGTNGSTRTTAYLYNAVGDLLQITYADDATVRVTYDNRGQQLTIVDENQQTTRFVYDSAGNLIQRSDPLQALAQYQYDAVGRLTQLTDANNHTAQFSYDGNDNVTQITDPKNQATDFTYDLNDNLIQMVDRRDGVTTYEYDENLKLIAETDPEGHTTRYSYDLMYNRASMTDPRGNVTRYGYNELYRLTTLTDALGNTTQFAYDPNGNLITITDALDQVTRYEYDARNRNTKRIDALNGVTSYSYDAVDRLLSATNPRGAVTQYGYDLRDRRIQIIDALNGIWTTAYDPVGNVIATTDANQQTTRLVYDAANRLQQAVDAEGHETSYTYDGVGNMLTVTNPRGHATTFVYDPNDNVTTIIDALAGETAYGYDAEDNRISMTDPDGHTTTYTFDLDDQLLTITDAENQVMHYTYDEANNQIAVTNGNDQTWRYTYDALNRPVAQIDPLDQEQRYLYDALSRQIALTDENGVTTRFAYDALDRLVTRVENERPAATPDAQTNVATHFTYDAVGNLLSEIDGNQNSTSYTYDLLDRVTHTENAEAEVTAYTYDPVGNLIALTNPRGFTTQFAYDGDNLLTQVTDARAGVTSITYDATHNRSDLRDANDIVTHYEYDELDRLTAEVRNYRPDLAPDFQTNVTTRYSYNADSTQATITDPNGNVTQYSHDGVHRLVAVTDALSGVTRYEYDAADNLLAQIDANNHRTSYRYDALNRPIAMQDPAGHAEEYTYDPVGNLLTLTNGRDFTTDFAYDDLYRMTQMTDALDGVVSATHDALGNLLALTDQNGHTQSWRYDNVYRPLSHTDAEGYITAFTYDENGNRVALTDGNSHATTYIFDELDRLSQQINAENETTSYLYDPVGNQVAQREADQVVTRYHFDPLYRLAGVTQNEQLSAIADHETNVHHTYSYDANGNLTAITDPLNHVTRFEYDALNRMVKETNPLDNSWHYGFDPVGNLASRLDANGALTQYSYSADDLLTRISYPDGSTISYAYDASHNMTAMSDEMGSSSWQFDALDRMTVATDAHSRTLTYTYDAVGNRTAISYPDGNHVQYSYLDNDWLRRVDLPTAQWTEYTRDGIGLTTGIANSNNTVTEHRYDNANRMLSTVTRQTSGAQKTVSAFHYTLDDVGQRVQTVADYGWRNPPQVTTEYSYDPLRRLVRSATDEGVWTEYDFDAAGNRLTLRTNDDALSPRPFGAQTLQYSYNDANQLLSVLDETNYTNGPTQKSGEKITQALQALRHEVAAQREKQINASAADTLLAAIDNLLADLYSPKPPKATQIAAALDGLRSQIAAYRSSGEIDSDGIANSLTAKVDKAAQANSGNGNASGDLQATLFTYDANGNRINATWPGPQGPPTQGIDYRYTYENRLYQALDYQGNGNGNRVDRGVTTMAYDGLFRRLRKSYDPKQGGGGLKATDTLFDGLNPVAEVDLWNGQYSDFYRGDGNRMVAVQRYPSSQMHWYAYDSLGTVTGLTKADGQSVHNYRYTDYGHVAPVNGNWTEPHNHYTYTGQPWDAETNLLHFYARDYDPVTGTWLQQDSYRGQLVEPVTLHRYGYVGGNPVNRVDWYGYQTCSTWDYIIGTNCVRRLNEAVADAKLLLIGAKARGGKPLSVTLFDHYFSASGMTYELDDTEIAIIRSDQDVQMVIEDLTIQAKENWNTGMSLSTLVLQDQTPEQRTDADTAVGDFTLGLQYESLGNTSVGEIELQLTFSIYDHYDFNPDVAPFCPQVKGIKILCFGFDEATMLEDNGFAKQFDVRGSWTETIKLKLFSESTAYDNVNTSVKNLQCQAPIAACTAQTVTNNITSLSNVSKRKK